MKRCPKLTKGQINELQLFLESSGPTSAELRRAQTVLLIDKGEEIEKITFITRYHRRHMYELRGRYIANGLDGIRSNRKTKRKLLSRGQAREIIRTIKKKNPKDLDYNTPFWTTAILGDHIDRIYGVKYRSRTSYYLLFKEAKFSYHKPGRKYHRRDERKVRQWQKQTRKKIKKAWKEQDTVILAEDELILSTQTTFQKIWLPKNQFPKVEVSNTRKNKSVYGFLNIKTGKQHAYSAEKQNMYITKRIVQRLRQSYPRNNNKKNRQRGEKLLIVWDQAGWHRGSEVQEYIEKDGKIEIIYFPTYSPEENPQEHVWKEARAQVTHNKFIKDIDAATEEFVGYLNNTRFFYSLLGFSAKM